MAVAITVTGVKADGQSVIVSGKAVFTGNYTTGGETFDFTAATPDISFQGPIGLIPSSTPATNFDLWDVGGNLANHAYPILGTTQKNNKIKFDSAFNTELSQAGYPAGITGSTFHWQAVFPKNV